jgi:hypothetical protein
MPLGPNSSRRLNMVLTLDGAELAGAQARRLDAAPCDSRPLGAQAKAWLRACVDAQRLMEANGADEIFERHPLRVRIDGARGPAPLRALPPMLADAGGRLLVHAAFEGAKAAEMWARKLGKAPKAAEGLRACAKALAESFANPVLATRGPQDYEVVLPCQTEYFDPERGVAPTTPFWSREETALYTVAHEAGHAAHFERGASMALRLGCDGDESARNLWASLGALEALGPHGQSLVSVFQEGYADCFAALAMGGADAERASLRAGQISTFRSLNIPSKASDYGQGDIEHDSREALALLAQELDERGCPRGGRDIDELCGRCAGLGALRWAQRLASEPAGAASWMLWARASEALASPLGRGMRPVLAQRFEDLKERALAVDDFAPLASCLGETESSKPALALGLEWLLRMRQAAGRPQVPLQGSRPLAPQACSLREKLEARSSAAGRRATTPKMI